MKQPYKINFQLFADEWSEDEKELFQSLGLDADGNPITKENAEDNPMDPLVINEDESVNPDNEPDNLTASSEGAVSPEVPVVPEDDSTNPSDEEPALQKQTPPILGKFKNQAELERAYLELQNRFGKQSNELGEIRKHLKHSTENVVPSPMDELFGGVSDEELMKGFSSNPKKFLKEMLDIAGSETLEKAKNAIREEAERERYLQEFFQDNSDFADLREDFIVISDRVSDPEIALNAVRGMKLGKLDNLFSDTVYLEKHLDSPGMKAILSDVTVIDRLSDKVKQKIISDHLKKVQASKSNVTLLSNDAGSLPKTPPKKYNSINDVTEDAVSFLKELEKNK